MPQRQGLTLIELIIVLMILVALGSLVIPAFMGNRDYAEETTTRANLIAIRDALMLYHEDVKHVRLPGPPATVAGEADRFQIAWLFNNPTLTVNVPPLQPNTPTFDPNTRQGWNGPYVVMKTGVYAVNDDRNLTDLYGDDDDPALLDSMTGTPIVIQWANAADWLTQWANNVTSLPPRDIRIVSAGRNGVINIPPEIHTEDLTDGHVQDDIYVAIQLR